MIGMVKCPLCGKDVDPKDFIAHFDSHSSGTSSNPSDSFLRPMRIDVQREVLAGLARMSEVSAEAYQELCKKYVPRQTLDKLNEVKRIVTDLILRVEGIL